VPRPPPSPPPPSLPPLPGTGISSQYILYFNVWRQGGSQYSGGAACLGVCSADPLCLGVQQYNTRQYQCYRITTVPTNLGTGVSQSVGAGLTPPAWSVFMKNPFYVAPPPLPPFSPPSSPPPASSLQDTVSSPTCNSWMQPTPYDGCNPSSVYYGYVSSRCQRTCAGIPTDRFSNCPSLVSLCANGVFGGGLTVREGCPDTCNGQLATEAHTATGTGLATRTHRATAPKSTARMPTLQPSGEAQNQPAEPRAEALLGTVITSHRDSSE